jgi:hypothetical protein
MRSVCLIFEVPADNIQTQLFESFIIKAINIILNPDVYPMIIAICTSMLAKPVLDNCAHFMKIVEKYAASRNDTVSYKIFVIIIAFIFYSSIFT